LIGFEAIIVFRQSSHTDDNGDISIMSKYFVYAIVIAFRVGAEKTDPASRGKSGYGSSHPLFGVLLF
jgi:hypothetical protein